MLAVIAIWPAFFLYVWWTDTKSGSLARFALGGGMVLLFLFLVNRIETGKREAERRAKILDQKSMEIAREYRNWYNRLSAFEKLRVDNEYLERKNAELQMELDSRAQ